MPPKEDPAAEILAIVKEAIAANKVDKATWGLIIPRKDVGKIKRRFAKLETQDTEAR